MVRVWVQIRREMLGSDRCTSYCWLFSLVWKLVVLGHRFPLDLRCWVSHISITFSFRLLAGWAITWWVDCWPAMELANWGEEQGIPHPTQKHTFLQRWRERWWWAWLCWFAFAAAACMCILHWQRQHSCGSHRWCPPRPTTWLRRFIGSRSVSTTSPPR